MVSPALVTYTPSVKPLLVPTVCGMNATLTGVTFTVEVSLTPSPDMLILRGLPGALLVIVSVPFRVVATLGAKVMDT